MTTLAKNRPSAKYNFTKYCMYELTKINIVQYVSHSFKQLNTFEHLKYFDCLALSHLDSLISIANAKQIVNTW